MMNSNRWVYRALTVVVAGVVVACASVENQKATKKWPIFAVWSSRDGVRCDHPAGSAITPEYSKRLIHKDLDRISAEQ